MFLFPSSSSQPSASLPLPSSSTNNSSKWQTLLGNIKPYWQQTHCQLDKRLLTETYKKCILAVVPSQLLSRRYQSKSIPRQDVLIGFTIQECQDFIKPIFPLLPEIGPGHCFCLVTILTLQIPWAFVVRTEDDDWKWRGREGGSTFIKSAPPI